MSENYLAKVIKCQKMDRKSVNMSELFWEHHGNFGHFNVLLFLRMSQFSDIFYTPETKKNKTMSRKFKTKSGIFMYDLIHAVLIRVKWRAYILAYFMNFKDNPL